MWELGISYQGSANLGGNVLGVGHFDYGNLANTLTNPLGVTGLTFGVASGSMCTVNSPSRRPPVLPPAPPRPA